MTDAVERRHEAIAPSSSVELQLPITGKPVPTEAARAMPVAPYVPEVSATTLPQAPVPEIDLTMWGNTLIDFGKFKGANRSYAELATSTSPRGANYRWWVLTHTRPSSSGELIDLFNYLKQVVPGHSTQSNVLIPGTNKPRVFK